VGGAFRGLHLCNNINSPIGHEYTYSANEYTHLSADAKGCPHLPVWSADSAVCAHLNGILDHIDNSSTHSICECRPPDKARVNNDLRVYRAELISQATQTLVRCSDCSSL